MDEIQILAAKAALQKMISDGYLSICIIDKILKMSGGIPCGRDYDILHTLHCVRFQDMDPELLRGIPVLIFRVLNAPGMDVDFKTLFGSRMLVGRN